MTGKKKKMKEGLIFKLALVNLNQSIFKRKKCIHSATRRDLSGKRRVLLYHKLSKGEVKIRNTGPHFPVNIKEEKQD